MAAMLVSAVMIVFLAIAFLSISGAGSSKTKSPLPPGPPGEPILGHLRVVPTDNPEHAYARWAKEYRSDVISVKMLASVPVIVVMS